MNILRVLALALLAFASQSSWGSLAISSTAFADGGAVPNLYGGTAGDCGGKGISLPAARSGLPDGSKSMAVVLFDIDGANGLGVSHWLAYNIAARRGSLRQGEAQADSTGITLGLNASGEARYRGMCPPAGDVAHHYILTVIATDLEPGAIAAGLDRAGQWQALKGHVLGAQSLVGRYAR